jgi:hypothetical protein
MMKELSDRQAKKGIVICMLLTISGMTTLSAQITEKEIAYDSVAKESFRDLGRAGFDSTATNGFYIQDSKEGRYRLNFGVWTTPRHTIISKNNTPDSVPNVIRDYAVNRTRIFLTGKYSEKFNFNLVTNIGADGGFNLQQVYLAYAINKNYIVTIGTQFVASSREDWMDPSNILAMQCSANDAVFALGSSFGVLVYRRPSNRMRWWASLSNGLYGWNRAVTGTNQSDYMIGGRYEYALKGDDWAVWDDLVGRRGRSEGILLGGSFNYLRQTVGLIKDRAAQANLDVSFNGDGYQALIAGVWTGQFPEGSRNFSQYGFYAQGGYFLNKYLQVYARYDLVLPGGTPGDYEAYSAPGFGVNFYPFHFTNRWKVTLEFNNLFGTFNNTIVPEDIALGFAESDYSGQQSIRLQLQFGF